MKTIIFFISLFILGGFVRPNFTITPTNPQINIDSIIRKDSVKYIIFTPTSYEYGNLATHHVDTISLGTFHSFDLSFPQGVGILTAYTGYDYRPIIKPRSFLNTIRYLDWDVVRPGLSEADGRKIRNYLKRLYKDNTTVYFIDRNEMTQSSIKIYKTKFPIHEDVIVPDDIIWDMPDNPLQN